LKGAGGPPALFFSSWRFVDQTGHAVMTDPSRLQESGVQTPVATVCFAASFALHCVLLLTSGSSGSGHRDASYPFSRDLRASLVDAGDSSAAASANDVLPTKLQPMSPIRRVYPKLLTLSPVDLPPKRFDESDYQPLSALTNPPTAAEQVEISYPYDPYRLGLLVAALTLFIDEDGVVVKVRAEEPHAPSNYERAAMEGFSKARFHPGRIGDRPVKARIVIRVAFESGGAGPSTSGGIRVK
jgi:hypothetical protein